MKARESTLCFRLRRLFRAHRSKRHELSLPHESSLAQIIEYLSNANLVVADLTDHKPNVLYELAIRYVVRKHIVQLIKSPAVGLPLHRLGHPCPNIGRS